MLKARVTGKSGETYIFQADEVKDLPTDMPVGIYILGRRMRDDYKGIGWYEKKEIFGIKEKDITIQVPSGDLKVYLYYPCSKDEVTTVLADLEETEMYKINLVDVIQ